MMMKRKSTGGILSPYFTPTRNGMEVSLFPMINLTTLSLYILEIADCADFGIFA